MAIVEDAGDHLPVSPGPALVDTGLDAEAVAQRVREGRVNVAPAHTSRTLGEIVRANVFTRFNAILGALLAVILVVGPLQDALFGVVLVTNSLIGIAQEVRAKRSLDRLALLSAPRARVVRAGHIGEVGADHVVADDVIDLAPGDQVVVDGVVLTASGLEVDESLLSGESEPVAKEPGESVLSGSFVASGSGRYQATRVGEEAYATALAAEARRFSLVRSELRLGIDKILRLVTWLIVPVAVLLVSSQLAAHENLPEALRGSVAGVGSMIPEGLVLLTSVAFAAGALRLARKRVLVQELAAVEGLARVDVVCLDKTGTITDPELRVTGIEPVGDGGASEASLARTLAAVAAADPHPNATLRAIAAAAPADGVTPARVVPFSSARKWSAVALDGGGTWLLGAPDVLLAGRPDAGAVASRAEELAAAGERVVLLAAAPADGGAGGGRAVGDGPGVLDGLERGTLPAALRPAGLVTLQERIREDAPETLRYFAEQGVAVKLISGDHPRTVAAVAARVGLDPGPPVDARELPDDPVRLADLMERATVFGRVTPHQKRAMVAALQSRGHVVAMTGDGVNDVLALKDADLGVAMGSGSAATRAVARIVLLDNSFATLPGVVAEGRRVIANVERVANLFLTKTVYAFLLAVAVGVAGLPFPFFPRHLTIVSSLTIGIPAFFLALAPAAARARLGFVGRVLRFSCPAGIVAAGATFSAYALARGEDTSLGEARTMATFVLFAVGLEVLAILARPFTGPRHLLVGSMAALFLVVLAVPPLREFFALDPPSLVLALAAVGIVALADAALESGWRLADRFRHSGLGERRRPAAQ